MDPKYVILFIYYYYYIFFYMFSLSMVTATLIQKYYCLMENSIIKKLYKVQNLDPYVKKHIQNKCMIIFIQK